MSWQKFIICILYSESNYITFNKDGCSFNQLSSSIWRSFFSHSFFIRIHSSRLLFNKFNSQSTNFCKVVASNGFKNSNISRFSYSRAINAAICNSKRVSRRNISNYWCTNRDFSSVVRMRAHKRDKLEHQPVDFHLVKFIESFCAFCVSNSFQSKRFAGERWIQNMENINNGVLIAFHLLITLSWQEFLLVPLPLRRCDAVTVVDSCLTLWTLSMQQSNVIITKRNSFAGSF